MGKCHSKKLKSSDIYRSGYQKQGAVVESKYPDGINKDYSKSIAKELLQHMDYDDIPQNAFREHNKNDIQPKSEPNLYFPIQQNPFKKPSPLNLSEQLLPSSSLSDVSYMKPELKKQDFQYNNLNDFCDENRFITSSKESLGFDVQPIEKLDHIPTLSSKNNIQLIERLEKSKNFEKWVCFILLEDNSPKPIPAFLYIYREDVLETRKNMLLQLRKHHYPQIASIHEVYITQTKDIYWLNNLTETVIIEYSRSTLNYIIEKRKNKRCSYLEEEVLKFLENALEGLVSLKNEKIPHLSLKTSSFIYTESSKYIENYFETYKISGLGEVLLIEKPNEAIRSLISIEIDNKHIRFIAPELLSYLVHDSENTNEPMRIENPYKCDIYSLGIVILDMLNLEATPIEYCKESYLPTLLDTLNKRYSVVVCLLRIMLKYDPDERKNAEELLEMFRDNPKKIPKEKEFIKSKKHNLKKTEQVNDLMFKKDFGLTKEETYEKICEFYQKGLIFMNLNQTNFAINFFLDSMKFERFLEIMNEPEIFDIYLNLGISYLHLDMYQSAKYYFFEAETWFNAAKHLFITRQTMDESNFLEITHNLFDKYSGPIEMEKSYMHKSTTLNINKFKSSVLMDETKIEGNEDVINKKIICIYYYEALIAYKLKNFEEAQLKLSNIWDYLNIKTISTNEFLCEYFELCGLLYNIFGKPQMALKCFQVYQEKSNHTEISLLNQAKLELGAGNYIQAWNLFNQLLLSYDSKENIDKFSNFKVLDVFGYLLYLSEIMKDKKEFAYYLQRTQDLWYKVSQTKEKNNGKLISDSVDWILRFGVYIQFFDEDHAITLKYVLNKIKETIDDYPQKDFSVYCYYNLGKAYYFTNTTNDALDCFTQGWQLIKDYLTINENVGFESHLTTYCAIDTFLWLSYMTGDEKYSEDLYVICDKLLRCVNPSKGFMIYFKTMRVKYFHKDKEDFDQYEGDLTEIDKLIAEDNEIDHYFKYYRPLSLFIEIKLLVLLRQDKSAQAKELIDKLLIDWLTYDRQQKYHDSKDIYLEDYNQVKRLEVKESYQFLCELSWLYEKIIFLFLKQSYIYNAKIILQKLKVNYDRKSLIEQNNVKRSSHTFILPSKECYIDLYSLLSTVSYQLDDSEDGFDYLILAYEYIEKIWYSQLQPERLIKVLLSLTFAMSQAYHIFGDYEKALEILETKRNIFEKQPNEVFNFYKTIQIFLKIRNFRFVEAENMINSLIKEFYYKYEKVKNRELFIKVLKLEIQVIEIQLETGRLDEGEKSLFEFMKKINGIYRDNSHQKTLLEKELEFKQNFQKVIAKYYDFLMDYEKTLSHLKKSYILCHNLYGKNSIFSLEINNLIVEVLIKLNKYSEAYEFFYEINESKNFKVKCLALSIRKKVESQVLIHVKRYEEALIAIDDSIKILGKRPFAEDVCTVSLKNDLFLILAETLFIKGKLLLILEQKVEGEKCFNEAYQLFEHKMQDVKYRHPLLIEILLVMITERMKRFKILDYINIIKGLQEFSPEEKIFFIDMFYDKKEERRMMNIFEKYNVEKNFEELKEFLKMLQIEKLDIVINKDHSERKKYKNYLLNKQSEKEETKNMIKKAHFLSIGLYSNHKENPLLKESKEYYRNLNDII